ncbi:PTS cellobiose transporter subunit IIC [Companilactobacillus allii]|uniref:Permease IIC component n=1 Tax=Companilactobacillus allii TaxID=1847728 RepID=A0A1P8Q0N2_9LACO|nr:PTS cellobiose transporter subunit IIC [Companilactobacillus allii]APX71433.1 PTS cellobiose transporter subunit IIC [Companilactobacillus allii]USQ68514.1 PTS cellobiose transporter subunit IIC [Companilactobacillus allii]
MDSNNKVFQFMEKYLMGPMGKLSQFRIVRGVMAAGMASIPFTIVGSMFLVLNILPDTFPALKGFFDATFFKFSDLYMLANTCTMGILSLYFGLVFGYEYTKIQAHEEKISVNPLNGALLSMFAFFLCLPELVVKGGTLKLVNSITSTETVVNGFRMSATIDRLGTSGIFTAIIMSILAVKLYCLCVKRNWIIKMPDTLPTGVSRSFTALIPTFVIVFVVLIINGTLVALGTDIFKMISIPFSFVTNLASSWLGVMVIYFLIHALWIVGIHGATIITSFLTPIVLANMEANQAGGNIPFAGEFNNMFVTVGGSGATLGMVIFITLFARSTQLKTLGKAAIVPSIFNINEPIIFGMPMVYNPYLAVPFFLAPMVAASISYFAIKFHMVHAVIAQVPWPSPVGLSGFIGTGGDWRGAVLGVVTALAATVIYYPFIKFYDNKLYTEEQAKGAEIAADAGDAVTD